MNFIRMAIAAFVLFGGVALSAELTGDARLGANPVLKALYQADAEKAGEVLTQLDEILAHPLSALPKTQKRSGDAEIDALADAPVLLENPALMEAYRRDPRATAKLIGIIRPALQ